MPTDPYRTLGLDRGASLDEVKRAYRRLAKANHPDRAGEGSLARFLEIQDAYDRIAGGTAGGATAGRGSSAGTGPRRPWDADPGRADATRRAYGSRTRRPRSGSAPDAGAGGGRGPGSTGAGRDAGSTADAGAAAPGTEAGGGRHRRGRGDRPPTKATLGSTSYDGADEGPFEPDWGGASWYGTTTGTYWTLNPKEYADPRKHGPEYQARARRTRSEAAEGGGGAPGEKALGGEAPGGGAPGGGTASTGPGDPRRAAPTHTTSSWWEATAAGSEPASPAAPAAGWEPPGTSAASPRRDPTPPQAGPHRSASQQTLDALRRASPDPSDPVDVPDPLFEASRWLEAGRGGIPARAGRAVLGWAPIALGIGWVAGEVTGCGRYSAGCDAAAAPLAWLAQLIVLALLLLVPRFASAASVATLVTLAAAVPGALILSATGTDAADTMAPLALGGLLVLGWVAGIVAGAVREIRLLRVAEPGDAPRPEGPAAPDDPTGGAAPVS